MPALSRKPAAALSMMDYPVLAIRAVPVADLLIANGLALPEPTIPTSDFRVPTSARLLLAADQLLALRWGRSSTWDCYLPAALLNAWHLALANAERGTRAQRAPLVGNAESQTAR